MTLPSRDPSSLLVRVSGSAKKTDSSLSGDSGSADDGLGRKLAKIDLFLFDRCDAVSDSAFALLLSSLLKGLSMPMMFVGIEGVHRASPLACGSGLESTSPIANNVVAQHQKSAKEKRETSGARRMSGKAITRVCRSELN